MFRRAKPVATSLADLDPKRVCTYQVFGLADLSPQNEETRVRVDELESVLPTVLGRTVLDLGCNGGLSSLLAARAGATSVYAMDVDADLISQLQRTADEHGLPVTAERIPFWELPTARAADVVFAFEIVHWLVHQGASLDQVARRLRELTGDVLFIETPWDATEPSIRVKETIKDHHYSARDLIAALLDSGFKVEVMHFSQYFGGDSKRVMLKASTRP